MLFNWADYVEYSYRIKCQEIFKNKGAVGDIACQTKLDKFIWRLHNHMESHLEGGSFDEVNVLIAMLGDYMNSCPTRVMSFQVVNICMESLLVLKTIVFSHNTQNPSELRMVHNMLVVFDEIAAQNVEFSLNNFLLDLFMHDDNLLYIRNYTHLLLFGILGNEKGTDGNKKMTITDFRARAIRHFEVCVGISNMILNL